MPPEAVKTTRMTFDEEFNSFSASADGSTGWMMRFPYGRDAAYTLADNQEEQFYSNPTIGYNPFNNHDGVLDITAQPGSNYMGLPYNSGLITTYGSFNQTYGYMEARVQLPAGQGLWPAFWLLPSSNVYTSELDVFEVIGSRPNVVNSTVHGWTDDQYFANAQGWVVPDTSAGYHTYGVDWGPTTTTFYMDGQALGSAATPESMNDPMYMLLNLAVGGEWPGSPDGSTQFPATMSIDYVRAYATANTTQVSGSAAIQGGATTPVPATTPAPAAAPIAPAAAPGPVTIGSGPDTIRLSLSEDAWNGDAQAVITVDNQTIGGTQTITAAHGAGQKQEISLAGNWGSGPHSVGIQFINDAYGGSPSADRNLYVDDVALNGVSASPSTTTMLANGTATFNVGSGSSDGNALVLRLSEDAYNGDAQFSVAVDGQQQGGVQTVTALHEDGATQDFTVGTGLTPGSHEVAITFLNDTYGGSALADRNLYVDGASYGGNALSGAASTLMGNGTTQFTFVVPG